MIRRDSRNKAREKTRSSKAISLVQRCWRSSKGVRRKMKSKMMIQVTRKRKSGKKYSMTLAMMNNTCRGIPPGADR